MFKGYRSSWVRITSMLFILFCLLQTTALSESASENGVTLNLSTNKSRYAAGDAIKETLTIENNSGLTLTDLLLELSIPDGYIVQADSASFLNAESLANGRTLTLTSTLIPVSIPQTGDKSNIFFWTFIFFGISGGLFILLKSKKIKEILALIVCMSLLSSVLAIPVISNAEDEQLSHRKTIQVSKTVSVASSERTLFGKASFNDGSNLDDGIIDIGDLELLIEQGVIEAIYDKYGNLLSIDGPFTSKAVRNKQEAASLLNSASSLFGEDFSADASNISVQTTTFGSEENTEVMYKFTPILGGIPVLGSQTILYTDEKGNVLGLNTTYDNKINHVNKTPTISASSAEQVAFDTLSASSSISNFVSAIEEESPLIF